jgi:D-glycero-D-manno-heptose 1,7-bisphosphate phosphatase
MSSSVRAIFFDRDGVVNYRIAGDYVRSPDQLVLIPDVFKALQKSGELGFIPILVTNQRGISLGRMSEEELDEIHRRLQRELSGRSDSIFKAIYFCPHGAEEGCDCRKPKPGMLLRAAREHNIDLAASWMVGDSQSDVTAGKEAGCGTAWVGRGGGQSGADVVGANLNEVMQRIEDVEIQRRSSRVGPFQAGPGA